MASGADAYYIKICQVNEKLLASEIEKGEPEEARCDREAAVKGPDGSEREVFSTVTTLLTRSGLDRTKHAGKDGLRSAIRDGKRSASMQILDLF